jgi:predicted lipoprotein
MSTVLDAVSQLQAARDVGDNKGDKARKRLLSSLLRKANEVAMKLPSEEKFPEVAEALRVAQTLSDVSVKLAQHIDQLRLAPPGSVEAAEAQKDLDQTRRNVDAMLKPMESTMETMDAMLDAAMEMEETYKKMQLQLAAMNDSLKRERARLASVAQALSNAAKIA